MVDTGNMNPRTQSSDYCSSDRTMPGRRDRVAARRFLPGDLILQRYEILSELGQGGMGVVYRCLDTIGGIEVALKALPPDLSHDVLEMEDIKDNFQLVSKLVHQNIAITKQLEKDESNGNYYLIMECCPGVNLRHWIKTKRREKPLTISDILPIIRQVAAALDYAHGQHIMHRDIKPGNIMIDSVTGSVKVLDFGLAAQIHTSMSRASMAYHGTSGTGPYMAPEQWRGRSQGAAADQYALAVIVYEMLAGHLPFDCADAAVLREVVLNDTPEEIHQIPKHISLALRRAMSKESSQRFENCQDFVDALEGKKVKWQKTVRKKSRNILLALLLLPVIGASVCYYHYEKQKQAAERKAEQERIAKEAAEKAERERIAKEAAEKAEQERIAKEAAEKAELERIAKEAAERKAEEERKAKEAAERKAELERIAKEASKKAEQERIAKEAAERKAEQERIAKEAAERKAELERIAKEAAERKAEQERKAREATEKAELERIAKEAAERKAEQERIAKEAAERKAELERKAKEAAARKAEEERKAKEVANHSTSVGIDMGDNEQLLLNVDISQPEKKSVKLKTFVLPGDVKVEMIKIPAGTFQMGSPSDELGRNRVELQHQVTITKDYWMGKFEVTQAQWLAIMTSNPSKFVNLENPVETVSWHEAKEFCDKLNEQFKHQLPAGYKFDLPTEAQWEYACRAGTTTAFNNGTKLTDAKHPCPNMNKVGWYKGNCEVRGPRNVGKKQPNAWNLYDMHGNVQEWCLDTLEDYHDNVVDPLIVSIFSSRRVVRGGCWSYAPRHCRSASRQKGFPGNKYAHVGFRLALVPIR